MAFKTKSLYQTFVGKLLLKLYRIDVNKLCNTKEKRLTISNDVFCANEYNNIKHFICQFIVDAYSVYAKNIMQLFFNLKQQTLNITHKQTIVKSDNITVQLSSNENDLLIDNLKIKHVHIVKTKNIAPDAFACCFNLQSVVADEPLETIDDDAFQNCISLKQVHLPKTIKHISFGAFSNCINLEKIVFH